MSRDDLRASAAKEVDRWEQALSDELIRVFDRQEAVVIARLQGTKARKHTRHWSPPGDRPLEVKGILDAARWLLDAANTARPVLGRMFGSAYGRVAKQMDDDASTDAGDDRAGEVVDRAVELIRKGVEGAQEEVEALIKREEDAGTPMPQIVSQVRDLYADRKPSWAARIATISTVGTINHAGLMAAGDNGSSAKQWLSRRDSKVRDTHQAADGQVRLLDERFRLGGPKTSKPRSLLLFPGDPAPSVPLNEIMNCRCTLLFSPPRKRQAKADPTLEELEQMRDELEQKATRRVRTAGGARQYGQSIGSVIRADVIGSIAGLGDIEIASRDQDVRRMIKTQQPGLDQTDTRVAVLRDARGRVGAYAVWNKRSGDVVAVSVHPKLRGNQVGNQLVDAVVAHDPTVKPQTRLARVATAAQTAANMQAAPPPAAAPAPARVRTPRPTGAPGDLGTIRPAGVRSSDQPGTSGDYDADAKRIDRLQKAYMLERRDTQSLFSRGGRWSKEREAEHKAIVDHFLNQPGVKADHQLLVLGGMPGAGKTTTLNSPAAQAALGVDLSEYVTVNSDDVKAEMIARGLVPDYPGLSPEESIAMIQAESYEIAQVVMRQAAKRGLNFAYDATLRTSGQLGAPEAAISRHAPPGYETTMVLVDVPMATAKQRARDRYLAGDRYVPLGFIDGMKSSSPRFKSAPEENFEGFKRRVDRWAVFDNSGAAPQLVAQGGAPGRTAAPAPVAAPTPAPPAPAAPAAPAPVTGRPAGLPAALPDPPAGARVFTHPQGKTVYVLPDGSLAVYKPDGKRGTTSATAAKLLAGYGGWSELGADTGTPLTATPTPPAPKAAAAAPPLVAAPKAALDVSAGTPAPAGSLPVTPMDFNEAPLADVPRYIADDDYVFQQKVDGIRGVLVIEPGKAPWFASKKGDRLQSSTAAKTTDPMLAKLPATPANAPAYRVEGEILDGKFHVFDMVIVGQEHTDYETRSTMANAWVDAVKDSLPQVQALPTARTAAEKQALWDKVLASGAEGVMMKRRDAGYSGGQRVSHTLKAKITATADVVVLERNRGGKDNAVFGMLQNGHVVEIGTVSTGGKDKALGQIQIGDVLELEYLWASPGGTLTQPRIVRKRKDKTANDATSIDQLRFVDKTVLALAAKSMRIRLEHQIERATDAVGS